MTRHYSNQRWWWSMLILLSISLEAVALYYQYELDYLPCVLCIHVRMLLAAILLVGIVGWIGAGNKAFSVITLLLVGGLWGWMSERSYQLLGVEQGWILGECQMQSGLPDWLALEKWMPWLFEIHEPCGYTPYLLFKISMAEVLIVLSPLLLVWTLIMLFRVISRR